jgi:hypothetical protein
MHIIGKISDASHITTCTQKINANTGIPKRIYRLTQMAAGLSIVAGVATDGKNKNITRTTTKSVNAGNR